MSHKVLIIDDDPAVHALVGVHICSAQITWFGAYDGESGLALAAKYKPDLILLDVDLPDLNGHEVCRQLKSDRGTRGIPVLFLSAAASREEKVVGLDLGAVDYVTKPFDPAELRARTSAALRAKKSVDRLASINMVDEVTGLYNRTYLDRQLRVALAQARRWDQTLGCILIALDHFDGISAEFGRAAAEAVLKNAAAALLQTCGEEDLLCLFGEGQFAILAFSTEAQSAVELADRLRKDIRALTTAYGNAEIRITATCGVALARSAWETSIIIEAQEALRQAREIGGDCVRAVGVEEVLRCG